MIKGWDIQVQFQAPAAVSDLVWLWYTIQPAPCVKGLKIAEVHCVFAQPACRFALHTVADSGGLG